MCGIAGKISFAGSTVQPEDVKRMVHAIRHRGPDDQGIYVNPVNTVGLGHARLSIIDTTSAGHQPMSWKDKYWIVFNGEIYNYKDLKKSIQTPFHSHTDTEVILALYEQHGPACVGYLEGMFAFAIYDTEKNTLFCARDRFGQKPFKYTLTKESFIFASEIKSILTQREYIKEPDLGALHNYLTFGYCPSPSTGFKGIKKLEPGHTLTINTLTGSSTVEPYWQPPRPTKIDQTPKKYGQVIRQTLTDAVTKRLISDVPLGAFLSGGLDSSIIVGLMAQVSSKKPQTFSIGFKDKQYNELPFARIAAKEFNTEHTELIVQPEDVESAPELAAQFDEPFADSSALATHILSKLTRKHVTVALSGDGGDELFGGYKRYTWLAYLSQYGRTAHLLGKTLHRIYPTNATNRLNQYTRSYPNTANQYQDMMSIFSGKENSKYATGPLQKAPSNVRTFTPFFQNTPPIHGARYTDMSTYLPDDLLVKVDITSMAHGLEVRSPFLDHTLIEAIKNIPTRHLRQKQILKDAFSDMIPSQILKRNKKGFTVPLQAWLKGDIDTYIESILLSSKTAARGYYNQQEIKHLLTQHKRRIGNFAPQLWALLMLELWFRTYFD